VKALFPVDRGIFVAWSLSAAGLLGCGPGSEHLAEEPLEVSTSASRTAYLSGNGQWARMPEGMHATGSGTNLWTVTEGVSGVTDPALGGRVVFFAAQASLD
jgi:hypothetical protein